MTLDHIVETGRGLDSAMAAYNAMVGSMQRRVLPTLRDFNELGISGEELPEVKPVERSARKLTAPELESEPESTA